MAWMVEQQRLLTAGVNGNDGCELWVSQGFESSTQFLLDINPNGDALPGQFLGITSVPTMYGERVFFDADDGVHGRQLWVSDATSSGTKRVVSNGDSLSLTSSAHLVPWGQGVVVNTANDALMWTDGINLNTVFSHPGFSAAQQQNLDTFSFGMVTFATEMLHSNSTHLWFSAKAQNDIEPYLITLDAEFQSWDLNPSGASQPNAPTIIEGGLVLVAESQNGRQLVRLGDDGSQNWLTTLQHQGTGNPTTHVAEHLGIHQLGSLYRVFDALNVWCGPPSVVSQPLFWSIPRSCQQLIVAPGDWAGGLVHQQRVWFDCVAPHVWLMRSVQAMARSSGTRGWKPIYEQGWPVRIFSGLRHYGEHLFFLASGQSDGIESGSSLWHLPTEWNCQA